MLSRIDFDVWPHPSDWSPTALFLLVLVLFLVLLAIQLLILRRLRQVERLVGRSENSSTDGGGSFPMDD